MSRPAAGHGDRRRAQQITVPDAKRTDVAVLGATGLVGQRLVRSLRQHPWFRVGELVGSPRSAGRRFGDYADLQGGDDLPEILASKTLLAPGDELCSPIVLSALPGLAAEELEPTYAERGHLVCSNASAFRGHPAVPLVVPEINPQALALVATQPWRGRAGGIAGKAGGIVANPNCMVNGLSLVLAPLHRAFGIESITVVTMQAISGAGRSALTAYQTAGSAAAGNVVPAIANEAQKVASEPLKILDANFPVSVMVNRVPVENGHLASVFLKLRECPALAAATEALQQWRAPEAVRALPSCPHRPVAVSAEPDAPQPKLHLGAGNGMTVTVGGIEADPIYDLRLTLLVHNLVRGAAGACLFNAELALAHGLVPSYGQAHTVAGVHQEARFPAEAVEA